MALVDDGPNNEHIGSDGDNHAFTGSMDSSIQSSFIRNSSYTPHMEEKLRRSLKFFFMNPYEKWKAKRRFPWKLLLQLVKIVLVTVQLSLFGSMHSNYVTFIERNTIAFHHIFLKNWTPSYETLPYPPATGAYAIYKRDELYQHINHAMQKYNLTRELGIGGYQFLTTKNSTVPLPMEMCKKRFMDTEVYPNGSFIFNSETETECFPVYPVRSKNGTDKYVYDIVTYLKNIDHSIDFDIMLELKLKFPLRSINLETYAKHAAPKCYIFHIEIIFDNNEHDGQLLVRLLADVEAIKCSGEILYKEGNNSRRKILTAFYAVIIIVSVLSLSLCVRSIVKALKTGRLVKRFFKIRYDKKLSLGDRMEFFNMWYMLIVCNDIMTIIGTVFLIVIISHVTDISPVNYNVVGVLLGTGSLFTWFGILRYLGFFKSYNVLLLTVKKATPNVFRFLVCATMMYCGFMFCGWVVLGPYHIKFRTLSSTAECLFSLINGDDMYVTFASTQTTSNWTWIYSVIYLYTFIFLFIYIVLSLFIAVIMDTYETIKHYYLNGYPKTDLFEFIDQCSDPPSSPLYRSENQSSVWKWLSSCCRRRDTSDGVNHHLTATCPTA